MPSSFSTGRFLLGLAIILAGLGTLFQRLNIFDFGPIISNWWPLLLILAGILQFIKTPRSIIGGAMFTLIGLFFLDRSQNLIPIKFHSLFWPIIIIFVGLWILMGKKKSFSFHKNRGISDNKNLLDYFTLFSGLDTRIESDDFKGGSVMAIFGGAKIDLRDTALSQSDVRLDLSAAFGGIEIIVPENWKIVSTGLPLFGGFDNKTRGKTTDSTAPTLTINYLALFGGIEIKN